ncbi:protein CLP1 [Scheffersomyces xylosifermentans]|uniref:protein CLP1 n=1 Tax=Scheffersomyces xylosifermentans TaxID=1304137 RepID=UPI00315E02C1
MAILACTRPPYPLQIFEFLKPSTALDTLFFPQVQNELHRMSIPGFGGDASSTYSDIPKDKIELEIPGGSEWRIEVPHKTILKVKVISGVAEIFGTELPVNIEIQLTGVKYAIYSPLPEGAKLEYTTSQNKAVISNESEELVEYISEESVMKNYINLHLALEAMRQQVSDNNILNPTTLKTGPKVLIIGNATSGKTTLAKILSSYAIKSDSSPILVNLNPRDGVFSLPGSITATPISDSLDIESANGWGFTTTSGSLYHNPKQPIVKNYGFSSIEENLDLYKYQISKLGVTVLSRLEEDVNVRNGGIIIDTPPLSIKDITVIENIVSDFEVNIIVVLGNERLTIDLKKRFKHKASSLTVVKVPKSGGVADADEAFIRRTQEETIKEYFNGNSKTRLSPFKTDIDVKDHTIYKCVLASDFASSLSFLPSGDSYTVEDDQKEDKDKSDEELNKYYTLLSEPSGSNLDNSIVAITQLPQANESSRELLNTSILGYVHISKVDDAKGKMKILLPFPGAFPRNVLISTNIGFNE